MVTSRGQHRATTYSAFLRLETSPAPIALPAEAILDVTRMTEWKSCEPLPFGSLLPVEFVDFDPLSVLRLSDGRLTIATCVSGPTKIERLGTDCIFTLPQWHAPGFGFFSDVIVTNGQPIALIVNMNALFTAFREVGE